MNAVHFKRILLVGSAILASLLTGCNVMPPQAMTHSPQFEPVYPIKQVQASSATGAHPATL